MDRYYPEKSGQAPGVTPVPYTLNANPIEMDNLPLDNHQPKPMPHSTLPGVTPYLGPRARLSQAWFNKWTVLLLLVLVRVLILTGSLNSDLADAKVKALSACSKVEDIGSAMASMPHYLSAGVNSLAADGISKTVRGMVEILDMILTGVQALLMFVINMYIGLWVCLATALIHGTFDVATGAIKGVTDGMNKGIEKISGNLNNHVKDVQDTINKAFGLITGFPGVSKPPQIDLGKELDDLKNLQFDSRPLVKGLADLNRTIPSFAEAENAARNALAIPFKLVQDQMVGRFGNYSFDRSVFPLAKKQKLEFCSNNSFLNDFFEKLFKIVRSAKLGFSIAIPLLAVLVIVLVGIMEVRRWNKERETAREFTEAGYDPMDVVYISSRPYTANFGLKLSARFHGKKSLLVRWTVAYATSLPALFVLALAVAGLFSCLCQYIVLQAIQKEAPALTSQVGDFAGDVVGSLQAVSTDWASDANAVILSLQDDINGDMFGWVRNATSAANKTLATLDAELDDSVTALFKDTVLLNTARNLVQCVIGSKIDAVEKGLIWVHEHAKVTLPLFANNTFSQGADDSTQGNSSMTSFLATPASVTTDEVSGAITQVITYIQGGIVQEMLISIGLLLVYVIVVLTGVVWSLVELAGRDKTRGEGGPRYAERDVSPPPAPAYEEDVVSKGQVLRGRAEMGRYPSHARKSSHPEVYWPDR
ncbi:plasma membrane fusion protein PRM1 [Podospora conica]|nr:plasma membrane fusion protein PRM1 [Schizothecium conicum]